MKNEGKYLLVCRNPRNLEDSGHQRFRNKVAYMKATKTLEKRGYDVALVNETYNKGRSISSFVSKLRKL